ncbi:MAG TPA: hypothetical protein VLZ78_02640 [Terrimesophilobacter sp.]|nr:hypothetical protein [Terrimesophilobacter sp.]
MSTATNPTRIGSAIYVADATALAALDASNLNPGTRVRRQDTDTDWVLTVVSGGGVAVSGYSGLRWIEDAGGGSVPDWVMDSRARASELSGGALDGGSEWFTDFAENSIWATTTASGATAPQSKLLDSGIATLTTTTTNGSSVLVHPAGAPSLISALTTKRIYAAFRVRFAGPSGAQCSLRAGLIVPDFSKNTWFGMSGSGINGGSDTKFVVESFDGVTATPVATAVDLETASYHKVEVYADGPGTGLVTYYFDGVAMTPTVAASVLGAVPIMPFIWAFTGTGSIARTMPADWMYARFLAL